MTAAQLVMATFTDHGAGVRAAVLATSAECATHARHARTARHPVNTVPQPPAKRATRQYPARRKPARCVVWGALMATWVVVVAQVLDGAYTPLQHVTHPDADTGESTLTPTVEQAYPPTYWRTW